MMSDEVSKAEAEGRSREAANAGSEAKNETFSLAAGSAPAVPLPAATVLLLRDDPFEVLMIRRHHKQFFSSALVFPGGLVHASDHSDDWLPLVADDEGLGRDQFALRIAAFRETYEESGVLLARREDGTHLSEAAPGDFVDPPDFIDIVRNSGGRLHFADLVRFGHWITPDWSPKRFDTHFFLARMPSDQKAVCDGSEAVALEWSPPAEIIARAEAGESSILFPTLMNLYLLAREQDVAGSIAAWRQREVFTVRPSVEKREGGTAFVIPAEAGYPKIEYFLKGA
ncbi:NUDIX hydrolase [Rhizorhapis sp. SPR117]|uniref:NUDIX hydrolase n=1 Tax=Rhizorhapis sp. SPR117 TaxID=2912611 RepID=UPI001F2E9C08|nr:NUDIX hydrolase [Rhizorhapis sp. SPR117]